jgi:PleD family two-component response regulator
MTNLSTLPINKSPLLQLPVLIATILQHSARMKQIEIDYSLAKEEMHYKYELEKTKLQQNLEQFKIMAELTRQQFDHGHIERMEILQIVSSMTTDMSHLQDSQSIMTFKEIINGLLENYAQSMSNVKSLESAQNKLIGAR